MYFTYYFKSKYYFPCYCSNLFVKMFLIKYFYLIFHDFILNILKIILFECLILLNTYHFILIYFDFIDWILLNLNKCALELNYEMIIIMTFFAIDFMSFLNHFIVFHSFLILFICNYYIASCLIFSFFQVIINVIYYSSFIISPLFFSMIRESDSQQSTLFK